MKENKTFHRKGVSRMKRDSLSLWERAGVKVVVND